MDTLVDLSSAETKQSNFEHGFRPVYYVSRLAGLWPFSIRHNSDGTIQRAHISFFDGLWFAIAFCLNLTFTITACARLKTGIEANGNEKGTLQLRIIIYDVLQTTSLLFGTIGIVLDMINRNKLVDILEKIIQFDNEVRCFG